MAQLLGILMSIKMVRTSICEQRWLHDGEVREILPFTTFESGVLSAIDFLSDYIFNSV